VLRRFLFLLCGLFAGEPSLRAFSLLTYNVAGNGAADWSTNAGQVQAIGRQMRYLKPDVITFNEIPYPLTFEMTNFIKAYLPGYVLASNSGTDGSIRSVVVSRFPIARSQKWLDGVSLSTFGYNGTFTRDLFEAEINVPNFERPLHVFTTHLKAFSDSDSAARRGAEAAAISNFFVTTFMPVNGARPYVLAGDMNEDVSRPPSTSQRPIERMANSNTGLRLTTPRNPINNDERTFSIRASLTIRFDYVFPCGMLFSNIASSQVFRTDLLNPVPSSLQPADDKTASDHLPVLMIFNNPYDRPFRVTSIRQAAGSVTLSWETASNRQYRIESGIDFGSWRTVATNLVATGNSLSWTTNVSVSREFLRVYREP
jgi:endonuclease/exonuclease/phosphatase family metal-dependent hydrolase